MLIKEHKKLRENKILSPKNYLTYTNENGQRISLKKRGKKRYFCFIQYRFDDIYCLLQYNLGISEIKDNFVYNDLKFVHTDLYKVRKFLINLSKEKKKSITFSLNSIKIN